MAFADKSRFTAIGSKNNGEYNLFFEKNSFVYVADLFAIIKQDEIINETGKEPLLSQLKLVDVTFPIDDGIENHNIHEITVLGIQKKPTEEIKDPNDLYSKAALLWPSYYNEGNIQSRLDDKSPSGSSYFDQPFEGSISYKAGQPIRK